VLPLNLFVNVSGSSNINQITNGSNQMLVYPNPTKGIINILSEKNIQTIKIINLLGEVIYNKQANTKENSIDIGSYPAGIYLLYTQEEAKTPLIQKIILE
jgi:hypothetical protein